jgi:hypothetical protein
MTKTLAKFEKMMAANSDDRAAWYRLGKELLIASYHAAPEIAAQLTDRAEIARMRSCR